MFLEGLEIFCSYRKSSPGLASWHYKLYYINAPYNDVSAKDGPYIRRRSRKIIIVKIKQSHYRPAGLEGSRSLRLPDFCTIGT